MNNRLLQPKDLPNSLWRSSANTLVLPATLTNIYEQMLKDNGLHTTALSSNTDDGPVGGINKEDSDRHFATRFSGSAARTQLSILDPKNDLSNASDLFVKAFSGGTVGLLDIPSGAGAATIDLMLTIACLRKSGVLPRQPLTVKLVCGDLSPHARSYASEMLQAISDDLIEQSICVHEESLEWDVCDAESTTAILHRWMEHAPDCREYFVVMANFSGFLQRDSKFNKAKPQLDEVIRWAAQRRSTVIWIEPQTNVVTNGFIPRISKWFESKLPRSFKMLWDNSSDALKSQCRYQHPVKSHSPRVNLTLIQLEASES